MASKLNINRGTTFNITVNYQKNGVAADLTGATIRFTVKANEYDADDLDAAAVVLKNITSHTNPSQGISTIALAPTDTQNIAPNSYWYDIKVQEANGSVYKIDEGHFVLAGSATNRLV